MLKKCYEIKNATKSEILYAILYVNQRLTRQKAYSCYSVDVNSFFSEKLHLKNCVHLVNHISFSRIICFLSDSKHLDGI